MQEPGVTYMADTFQYRHLVDTHYSSAALIPECNGLLEFKEDTGPLCLSENLIL